MNALLFQGSELVVREHDGIAWTTATDLSRFLGYARSDEVSRLYQRHADEFSEQMTTVIRLPQSEVLREGLPQSGVLRDDQTGVLRSSVPNATTEIRLFSLRGAHLIAMLARTAIGKACRRWLLDLAEREAGGDRRAFDRQKHEVLGIKEVFGEDDARIAARAFGWKVRAPKRLPKPPAARPQADAILDRLTVAALKLCPHAPEGVTGSELCSEAGIPDGAVTADTWRRFNAFAQGAGMTRARRGWRMTIS